MRLFVTVVVLACAPCVIAQSAGADAPVQKSLPRPQAPTQKPRIRRAGLPGTGPGSEKAANVPPGAPVVTLLGLCSERQPKSACETVITREDLDRFVGVFASDASEVTRSRMAVQYARTLTYSALAERQALDKNPVLVKELEVQTKLLRERILASAFLQTLQRKPAMNIAEAEVRKYYDEHGNQYEQVQVRRLAVPAAVPTESGRPLDRSAVKSEMDELRSRAVAGEDLNQLQQDAYKHLHIQAPAPPVNVSVLRRNTVQGDEAKAFDLSPGEISAVLDLPAAFAFVKLESKEKVPIESVRQEIEAGLRREWMQKDLSKLTEKMSALFNLNYFGMSSQPDIFSTAVMSSPVTPAGTRPTTDSRP